MSRLADWLHRVDQAVMRLVCGPDTVTGARRSTGRRWQW